MVSFQSTNRRHAPTSAFGPMFLLLALCLVAFLPSQASAFYIPGAQPVFYSVGSEVPFWVNALRSNSVMFPQEYYRLPFCKPEKVTTKKETMGEHIWGDRQQTSLYVANMLEDVKCMPVPQCDVAENNRLIRKNIAVLKKYIDNGYRGFVNIDNLPAFDTGAGVQRPSFPGRGYPLGVPAKKEKYHRTVVNNHLHFDISYNINPMNDQEYMVVGLTATPSSVKHTESSCNSEFEVTPETELLTIVDIVETDVQVQWTYSVHWEHRPDIVWATRWDAYFHSSVAGSAKNVHFAYILLSIVIVVFVASAVSMILVRALRLDFMRYNAINDPELQEETGWKLIYADVFRAPDFAELLSALTGTGAQILCMVGFVVFLALLGLLSPSRRGALLKAVLMTYFSSAVVGGLVCGALLNYFHLKKWKYVFLCGTGFPGVVCGVYLIANTFSAIYGATSAVSFGTIFSLMLLWIFINIPLTVVGASIGFRLEPFTNPVSVGRLAREIPKQKLVNDPALLFTIPPLFPLCSIIMELYFIMEALWMGQVYYVFGFLAVTWILWVIVVSLVTIFHIYYILCNENHQWWWYSFIIPGCMGVHVMLYAVYFFFTQMSITNFASMLLYFLYMGIFSVAYGLASGTIGLISSICFVRFIYARVRID